MALLSKGGTTSPDIILIFILSICCLTSLTLNPLILRYNFKKKPSLPAVLFIVLASLDLLTVLVITPRIIYVIAQPEMDYIEKPDVWIRIYYFVGWILITVPSIVVAMMAICRFIKIKFPLRILKVRNLVIFSCLIGLYTGVLSGLMCFTEKSQYDERLLMMYNRFWMKTAHISITLIWLPCLICQSVSIVTSILTVLHLYQNSKESISKKSSKNGRKGSIKILIMNLGNVISQFLVFLTLVTGNSPARRYVRVAGFVVSSSLISAINPALFVVFTREVFQFRRNLPSTRRFTFA